MLTAPVSIKRLNPRAKLPAYGSADAAGADLYALTDGPVSIAPGQTALIHTGLALAIPQGYVGWCTPAPAWPPSRAWLRPTRWASSTRITGES